MIRKTKYITIALIAVIFLSGGIPVAGAVLFPSEYGGISKITDISSKSLGLSECPTCGLDYNISGDIVPYQSEYPFSCNCPFCDFEEGEPCPCECQGYETEPKYPFSCNCPFCDFEEGEPCPCECQGYDTGPSYPFECNCPYYYSDDDESCPCECCPENGDDDSSCDICSGTQATSSKLKAIPGYFIAAFDANSTSGQVPFTVQFNDRSSGWPDTWLWDFGDGTTSASKNPAHTYTQPGLYSVSLTISKTYGAVTESRTTGKSEYIAAGGTPPVFVTPTPVQNTFIPGGSSGVTVPLKTGSLDSGGKTGLFQSLNPVTMPKPVTTEYGGKFPPKTVILL